MNIGDSPVCSHVITEAAIRERLRQFLVSTFYVPSANELRDDASLLEAGIVDSTGVLEIVAFVQSEFGVHVEDSELSPENLDTISGQVRFVARKLGTASA